MNETGTFEVAVKLGGCATITQGEFYGYLLNVKGALPWWRRVQLWFMLKQEPWKTVVKTEREDWRAAAASVGDAWSYTIASRLGDKYSMISDSDFLNYVFGRKRDVPVIKRIRMLFGPWRTTITMALWALTCENFNVFSKEELVASLMRKIELSN